MIVPQIFVTLAGNSMCCLTQVNPENRLGSGPAGAEDIKAHHWFTGFDWQAMQERRLRAPFTPRLKNPLDTSNFDTFKDGDLPPTAPGRTDKFADQWEGLWEWINDPPARRTSN